MHSVTDRRTDRQKTVSCQIDQYHRLKTITQLHCFNHRCPQTPVWHARSSQRSVRLAMNVLASTQMSFMNINAWHWHRSVWKLGSALDPFAYYFFRRMTGFSVRRSLVWSAACTVAVKLSCHAVITSSQASRSNSRLTDPSANVWGSLSSNINTVQVCMLWAESQMRFTKSRRTSTRKLYRLEKNSLGVILCRRKFSKLIFSWMVGESLDAFTFIVFDAMTPTPRGTHANSRVHVPYISRN